MRDMIKDTDEVKLVPKERKMKKKALVGIQTHDLVNSRHELYHCAIITVPI